MNPNTFWKRLKVLEKLSMISVKSNNKYSVISVLNWASYQIADDGSNNRVTTKEQQSNTDNKVNKVNKEIYSRVTECLNQKAGTNYKPTTRATQKVIDARINEGFSIEDMLKVIDIKTIDWKGTDYEKYLRPETLFGSKFESYLNTKPKDKNGQQSTTADITYLNFQEDPDE